MARPDHGPIDYHHILLPVHSVILTARNRVESLLMTPYSLDLWKDAPALRSHASASTRLRYEEWRRGDLLRHERHTGGSGDVRQDHDAHVPAH